MQNSPYFGGDTRGPSGIGLALTTMNGSALGFTVVMTSGYEGRGSPDERGLIRLNGLVCMLPEYVWIPQQS